MAEYIGREVVLSKCEEIWNNADETTQAGVETINVIDKITDFIESLPAADVRDVYYARCIIDNEGYERCSVCNEHETGMRYFAFCPRCGAKLDSHAEIKIEGVG